MRRFLVLLVLALSLASPTAARADLIWDTPAWSVTPSVSGEVPTYATGSASHGNIESDVLTGLLSAFAENPPGVGGPSVFARLLISRSFRVDAAELVTLRVPIAGTLSIGPIIGATGASLSVQFAIEGSPISISKSYNAPASPSATEVASAILQAGTYTIRGDVSLNAFATSGGPTATGNASISVGLSPTPLTVAGPTGLALLGRGLVGWLGVTWLWGRRAGARQGARPWHHAGTTQPRVPRRV